MLFDGIDALLFSFSVRYVFMSTILVPHEQITFTEKFEGRIDNIGIDKHFGQNIIVLI